MHSNRKPFKFKPPMGLLYGKKAKMSLLWAGRGVHFEQRAMYCVQHPQEQNGEQAANQKERQSI